MPTLPNLKIPAPPAITDEELAHVIASEDNSRFSVPLSVSEAHTEVDHGERVKDHTKPEPPPPLSTSTRLQAGVACTAYDVIVNSDVVPVLQEREGMREFVLELVFSRIEAKHSIALNRGTPLGK